MRIPSRLAQVGAPGHGGPHQRPLAAEMAWAPRVRHGWSLRVAVALTLLLVACQGDDVANPAGPSAMMAPPPPATAASGYSAGPLPAPDSTVDGVAWSVNDSGYAVGFLSIGLHNATPRPVYWGANGAVTYLQMGKRFSTGEARDLNLASEIVGWLSGTRGTFATVWRRGQPTTLVPLSTDMRSQANAINDAGVIVGSSTGASEHAVYWPVGRTTPKDIHPGPPWVSSVAADINERGAITGWATDGAGITHAFAWDASGVPYVLDVLSLGKVGIAMGRAINNSWEHVGYVRYSSASVGSPFRWVSNAWGTAVSTPGGYFDARANGISDMNRVVGSQDGPSAFDSPMAFSVTDTLAAAFLSPPYSLGYTARSEALDVNTCGWIVGWAHKQNWGRRPILWQRTVCD